MKDPKQLKVTGAIKRLFRKENEDAQIVLRYLVKTCSVFKPTFVVGDPYLSAFNEGQRRVVCSLLTHINKDMDRAIEQLRELTDETIA
jgi:hypothetical protein